MEREKITSHYSQSSIEIEENKIKAFSRDSRTSYSFRVYDGENVGIEYIQGKAEDEKGFAKARDNLSIGRPYKFSPETGSRRRDKTERTYTDKELMDIAREALEYLREHHPDYTFKGSVSADRNTMSMENSLGLDYSNTDYTVSANFSFKHKDSKDIDDGWFGLGQRTFEFSKFKDMADNYLTCFTEPAELPEELIIQKQYYEFLGKLNECLNAENMALGASLLSGKVGEKLFSDSFTLLHDVSDDETWNAPFFDGEGVVLPQDRYVYIENGVLLSGYADKRTADKYNVPHTGSAGFDLTDIPSNGNVNLRIKRSDKTVKELLGGRLTVVPIRAYGGGFNDKGEYVTPVQTAMLCDGERFIGRLPEFAVKGNMFDMFGKDLIGVGSDDPIFNDKQILMRMYYSK